MRVAVVGLGGVGGYISAKFAQAGVDVVGFARGKHLEAIQKDGLKIVEDTQTWQVSLNVKEKNEDSTPFDIVLFCTKSYDLEESFLQMSSAINEKTIIISFSNGVNSSKRLKELSNAHVLDGCIYILSHIQSSGVIRKKGKVFAAVFGGDDTATSKLSKLFEEANLRFKTPSDIKKAIWKKYIFIATFGTLTSYYNNTIGYVYEHHFNEAKALLQEISDLAESIGIDIAHEIENSLETAKSVPYDATTSMYLDFKNEKKDELETLSGFIVSLSKEREIKTPYMNKMYKELLKKHK